MKKILLFAVTFYSAFLTAQTYPSQNVNLLSMINPNNGGTGTGADGRRYAGCWGWKQTSTGKEYAIVGSSIGTYFIDVSNPSTPSVSAFVGGKTACTWREIKTYQNYCYVVSDDPSPNTFQIIDMSALPGTVTVVHDGTTYFERGHTIFINGDKMFIGSTTYSAGGGAFSSLNVYSLATPTAPVLLRRLDQDYNFVSVVHDMFVVGDTVFASCGYQGLQIFRFLTPANTFTQLGSYTNYDGAPYNHSSWITNNRQTLVFCDEVPAGKSIKVVNVNNLANIQPATTVAPHPLTTPHNPYVIGNSHAVVACYQDGLNIYNISNPATTYMTGYFDTYPQGGFNAGSNYGGQDYRGNWGAYPYLPSGIIIATDMQNGVFILDASQAFSPVAGLQEENKYASNLVVFPNPADEKFALHYSSNSNVSVEIKNILGETVYSKNFDGNVHEYIPVKNLSSGTYFVSVNDNGNIQSRKLIVTH